jgi:KaiC/GvpD/RAD55 family RecA-like ATPase
MFRIATARRMKRQEPKAIVLPYGDVVPRLLENIWKALADLCETAQKKERPKPALVNERFMWLNKLPSGAYPHLVFSRVQEGSLRTRGDEVPTIRTRISNLIIGAFAAAETESKATRGEVLASPLKILLRYLTVPEEPASRAYAFATLRLLLFEELELWPSTPLVPEGFKAFRQEEIYDTLASVNRYWIRRDNVPVEDPVKALVCHLLAMEGAMNLRVGTRKDRKTEDPLEARRRYYHNAELAPKDGYEFRMDSAVQRLPRAAELINQLWGLPLPIRGADTVFNGGLCFASEGGLVMAVTGGPGAGKTSFGLGLSAVSAPLGTRTFYVTAEESPEDLRVRLSGVTPDFLRRIQRSTRGGDTLFRAVRVLPDEDVPSASETLRTLVREMRDARPTRGETTQLGLPLPCPLIVVIDGLHLYLGGAFAGFKEHSDDFSLLQFILDARSLGALVILTWGHENAPLGSLDYLVDVLIRLDYRHTDRLDEKPLRILQLIKTRHQMSMPGTHVFHISGARGIRIAPQLPSQLDQRVLFKLRLPDQSSCIDVLNRTITFEELGELKHGRIAQARVRFIRPKAGLPRFLDIFPGSHILVHGRNSAGKSGFSLKLLTGPVVDLETGMPVSGRSVHRVLVVSFLYPGSYYHEILSRLEQLKTVEYPNAGASEVTSRDIDVIHFSPGYLNPEDMVTKILRRLDQADLEGEPFTGVLLDGVLVFLQFPRLERSPMIWTMLYGLFRRRDLTVVTTNTTITVRETDDPNEEQLLSLRKATPLLHAIVQGTDFFLTINGVGKPDDEQTEKIHEARYEVRVQVAIGQPQPTGVVYWHREKLVVYRDARQQELSLR